MNQIVRGPLSLNIRYPDKCRLPEIACVYQSFQLRVVNAHRIDLALSVILRHGLKL
jgi:hypothetical protein